MFPYRRQSQAELSKPGRQALEQIGASHQHSCTLVSHVGDERDKQGVDSGEVLL